MEDVILNKEELKLKGGELEQIHKDVIECLEKFLRDDDSIIEEINRMAEEKGSKIFSIALHILTHLEFKDQEAEKYWREIIALRETLITAIGRKVSLRTAICDYFCTIKESLNNPKVVEIRIFEETIRSSKYDNLTKLLNRRYLDEVLSIELARAKRYSAELSVLFFDLDDFKKLNDTFGHSAGDAALFNVAQIILELKRTEDIAARYGGEEMVVLLPETKKIEALALSERIRNRVEELKLKYDEQSIWLTLSGGVSSYPNDALTPETLLKCADKALYDAKAAGKNNIMLYSLKRRRYMRVDFFGETFVQKLDEKSPFNFKTNGKNLSTTGILFNSDTHFEIGDQLQLKFKIDHNSEPLLLSGTVVRVEALNNARYDIGVSFVEMNTTAKDKILNYIANSLKKLQI
tara:strand:- start:6411 stop:7628 length:1218 start_codon:yes stop_codon:yes gene_type:complete